MIYIGSFIRLTVRNEEDIEEFESVILARDTSYFSRVKCFHESLLYLSYLILGHSSEEWKEIYRWWKSR